MPPMLKPEESHTLVWDEVSKKSGWDERRKLVGSLRGQHIRIPDLHCFFQTWPEATNTQISALYPAVDQTLDNLFPPGNRRSRLRSTDPTLFGAMWWPYASLERLCIATYLAIWLLAWDDETDSLEFSDLAANFEEAQAFRAATLEFIRKHLAIDSQINEETLSTQPGSRRSIIGMFAPVGEAMVNHCTLEQRRTLMQEIELFISMSELEQRTQLSECLPSVEAYLHRRMGTSAVGVCLAIHEYALDIRLPKHVVDSPVMKSLWDETNIIISVSNDILSVKKEVAQGQVDSLIPLLYVAHGLDAQAAVDHADSLLTESVQRFNLAADTLLQDDAGDPVAIVDVAKFIDSCRYACTANLNWSLRSGRYKLHAESLHGGVSVVI